MYVPTLYKKVFLLCDFSSFSNCLDFSDSNENCSSFFRIISSKFRTFTFKVLITESFKTIFFCSNFKSSIVDTNCTLVPSPSIKSLITSFATGSRKDTIVSFCEKLLKLTNSKIINRILFLICISPYCKNIVLYSIYITID